MLAIFITIAIILIVAPLTIGIIFSVIKSSRNATQSKNQISYKYRFLFLQIRINMICFFVLFVVASDPLTKVKVNDAKIKNYPILPCLFYTIIDDLSRNIAQTNMLDLCDNGEPFNSTDETGIWIRFVGEGGTKLPISSPGRNHCGANYTGWFNGILPTIVDTKVDESVCFVKDSDDCFISLKSSVTYCLGDFYIYNLSPVPICNARYCTT